MKANKKVGIIGGVSPQSTNFIYEKIIEYSQKKYNATNNDDYPNLIIESVPVPDFISNKDHIEKAKKMLFDAVKSLTNSGASRLCIGSNTVHILLEELQQQTSVQFISMIDLVAEKCAKNNYKKVAILGTPVLLESGIYNKALEEKGIETLLPTNQQLEVVEHIIRQVIAGSSDEEKKTAYIATLND